MPVGLRVSFIFGVEAEDIATAIAELLASLYNLKQSRLDVLSRDSSRDPTRGTQPIYVYRTCQPLLDLDSINQFMIRYAGN